MKTLFLAASIAVAASVSALAGDLMAMKPYAFETARTAKAGGAYISIMSHGDADRLVSAVSPVAKRVEIHTHIKDGDVMRMRKVDGPLPVTANEPLKMGPGGVHVMLMGLNNPLDAGTEIPVTLIFEKAGELVVNVPVISREQAAEYGDHTSHGGHND